MFLFNRTKAFHKFSSKPNFSDSSEKHNQLGEKLESSIYRLLIDKLVIIKK